MDNLDSPAPVASVPAAPIVPVITAVSPQAVAMVPDKWTKYDGKDANAAMGKGLELCFASIVAIFIILGIYYLALKVLMRLFPAQAE